jgi:hypothetical protein
MLKWRSILVFAVVVAAGCGVFNGNPTSSSAPVTATTFDHGTLLPSVDTSTSIRTANGPSPGLILAPTRGVPAPTSGWIVSESPYEMAIIFPGQPAPDSVTINGASLNDNDSNWHQDWTSKPIDLAPGVNQLQLVVEYQEEVIHEVVIPVTYLDGADEQLGWITEANENSITVDFAEWNDDQEFSGPEDPDPGVTTSLQLAEAVRVIVSDEVDVDYEWLHDEVKSGYANLQSNPAYEDWNPNGIYPYQLTIYNGEVVQLWLVPLG